MLAQISGTIGGDANMTSEIIVLSKLETSKSEVRRLIKGNGIRINNKIITDEKLIIIKGLFKDSLLKLSLGKKKHIKIKLS